MLAVAARVGAPLGHDFCAISLSDNLKSWAVIERRVQAAANAGFVIAFYNPISRSRPWQLGRAFELLRGCLPPGTPVIFGRRSDETMNRFEYRPWPPPMQTMADMSTCVIIGSPETRIVERPNGSHWSIPAVDPNGGHMIKPRNDIADRVDRVACRFQWALNIRTRTQVRALRRVCRKPPARHYSS